MLMFLNVNGVVFFFGENGVWLWRSICYSVLFVVYISVYIR